MSSKKDIIFNAGLFATIVIGFVVFNFYSTPAEVKTVSFEGPQADLTLNPLAPNGSPMLFKDLKGKNLVLHFGASWCASCELEPPYLNELSATVESGTIKVISIASADNKPKYNPQGRYAQYADPTGNLALYLGVKTLPETLIIDSQGRLVAHINSALNASIVKKAKTELLNLKAKIPGDFGQAPKFELTAASGKKVTDKDLEGKAWVVDFIFTKCPAQCPLMTTRMQELQKQFKDSSDVHFVSVSVDPNHDTPEVLMAYATKFGISNDSWTFLTGSFGSVKKLIGRGFKLGTPEDPQLHTSKFVLVDKKKTIRGYYDSTIPQSLEQLKTDLRQIL